MAELSTKLVTGKCLFSYAHVFEPTAMEEGQEKKYNISILIPKSDKATIKKAQAAIKAAYDKGLSEKFQNKPPKNWDNPLKNGDDKEEESYANHFYLNAKSKIKPKIFDKDLNEILDPEEFYSGCFGRATLNFYAYNVAGNKGVGVGLQILCKLSDGEPLGAASSNPDEDFADNSKYLDDDEDFDDDDLE